jgi:hypothetical protein
MLLPPEPEMSEERASTMVLEALMSHAYTHECSTDGCGRSDIRFCDLCQRPYCTDHSRLYTDLTSSGTLSAYQYVCYDCRPGARRAVRRNGRGSSD